jgi:hypothetical protein
MHFKSIYKLAPDPEWAYWGFPINQTDGFVGNPKLHELNIGGVWSQLWFPCMTTEPIEFVTVNIGPEVSPSGRTCAACGWVGG